MVVDTRDLHGRCALALALLGGNVDAVQHLLDIGADPNVVDNDGDPVVCYASRITDESILGQLIEKTDPEALNWKALWYAVTANNVPLVALLLRQKADPNHQLACGDTALHTAVRLGHESLVSALLEGGASVSTLNQDGETALSLAPKQGYSEAVEDFLYRVPPTNSRRKAPVFEGLITILETLIRRISTVGKLSTKSLVMRVISLSGKTSLLTAIEDNRHEIFLFLISHGADVNVRGPGGEVVFLEACRKARLAMVDLLIDQWSWLEKGNDGCWQPSRDSNGESALHAAAESRSVFLMQRLLCLTGLDVGMTNDRGRTPLHEAVEAGDYEMVKVLLEAKAPLNTPDGSGKTIMDTALLLSNPSVVRLLVSFQAPTGVVWQESAPFVRKWATKPWYHMLKQIMENCKAAPVYGPFAINPSWSVDHVKRSGKMRGSLDGPDRSYLQLLVPLGRKYPVHVRRIVFTRTSQNLGPFSYSSKPFRMGILTGFGRNPIKPVEAQSNLHQSVEDRELSNYWDYRDPAAGNGEWLDLIQGGDVIQIFPLGCYSVWDSHITEAKIEICYEEARASEAAESSRTVSDSFAGFSPQSLPRVVLYHEPLFNEHGATTPISPFITEATGVTHIVVGTVHLSSPIHYPKDTTRNRDAVDSPKYEPVRKEIRKLGKSKFKLLMKLDCVHVLDSTSLEGPDSDRFEELYLPLRKILVLDTFNGIDLDFNQRTTINSIVRLIDRLRTDFGKQFLITVSLPVAAFQGKDHPAGYDCELLEVIRGDQIAWYNTKFYSSDTCTGFLDVGEYQAIANRGWLMQKIVVGLSTMPNHRAGYVSLAALKLLLAALSASHRRNFGGIGGWTYHDCSPADLKEPWEWAAAVSDLVRTYFDTVETSPADGKLQSHFNVKAEPNQSAGSVVLDRLQQSSGLDFENAHAKTIEISSSKSFSLAQKTFPSSSDIMAHHIIPELGSGLKYIGSWVTDKPTEKLIDKIHRS